MRCEPFEKKRSKQCPISIASQYPEILFPMLVRRHNKMINYLAAILLGLYLFFISQKSKRVQNWWTKYRWLHFRWWPSRWRSSKERFAPSFLSFCFPQFFTSLLLRTNVVLTCSGGMRWTHSKHSRLMLDAIPNIDCYNGIQSAHFFVNVCLG